VLMPQHTTFALIFARRAGPVTATPMNVLNQSWHLLDYWDIGTQSRIGENSQRMVSPTMYLDLP